MTPARSIYGQHYEYNNRKRLQVHWGGGGGVDGAAAIPEDLAGDSEHEVKMSKDFYEVSLSKG